MDPKHCKGCHDDPYNHGLGGAEKCWHLDNAEVIRRLRVGVDELPPWNRKPEMLPSCYTEPRFVFLNTEVRR